MSSEHTGGGPGSMAVSEDVSSAVADVYDVPIGPEAVEALHSSVYYRSEYAEYPASYGEASISAPSILSYVR